MIPIEVVLKKMIAPVVIGMCIRNSDVCEEKGTENKGNFYQ